MPRYIEINDSKSGVYKIISTYDDVIEKVSPLMWFGGYKFFQLVKLGGYPETAAREMVLEELRECMKKPCPDFLKALYGAPNKRDQESLLRGKSIKPDDLISWFLWGGREAGLFSQYSYDGGVPSEYRGRAPIMIDATQDENIKAIGQTSLSSAALRHIVATQNKVIAQYMDFPDGRWYCFYRTHRGLAGRESGNQGQHMHFISSAYGLNRESLIEGFKKGVCPSNGFHVHICGYWDAK